MSSGTSAALFDLAKTIRSKILGVDRITFILIFADRTAYEPMRRSGARQPMDIRRSAGATPAASSSILYWPSSSLSAACAPRQPSSTSINRF